MRTFILMKMQKCSWGIINCSPQTRGFQKQLNHLRREWLKWIRSRQTKQFYKWCNVNLVKIRGQELIQWKWEEQVTSQNKKQWTISPEKCLVRTFMIRERIHKVDSNHLLCRLINTPTIFWRGLLKIQILSHHLILINQIQRST